MDSCRPFCENTIEFVTPFLSDALRVLARLGVLEVSVRTPQNTCEVSLWNVVFENLDPHQVLKKDPTIDALLLLAPALLSAFLPPTKPR